MSFMLELKHHCTCVRKIQYEGVCRKANTTRGEAECCIFRTHKQGGALSVILYFLVTSGSAGFSLVLKPL